MKQRQPLRTRHTILLTFALVVCSTALGAGALHRYQLYRSIREGQRQRAVAMAEAYAAGLAPRLSGADRTELAKSVREAALHPDVCLLVVLDNERDPIAWRGSEALLDRWRAAPEPGWQVVSIVPAGDATGRVDLDIGAVPIRHGSAPEILGTLVCAVRPALRTSIEPASVWKFFARLALIAAAGMLVGVWWLRRSVLMPLAMLTKGSHAEESRHLRLPTDREDEIGEVARALSEIHMSLDEWRERAIRLERSVNERVAESTRDVTRELQQAKRKIWMDPLTKLGNRRLLDDRFAGIFNAQRERRQDLSVIMIDVDNFKPVNDALGHRAGDEVLRFTGELLKQCLREQDLAIRMGGDEFLLVLPGVSAANAHAVAERTLLLFAQQSKLLSVEPRPTMSAGVASLAAQKPTDAETLLQMADQALYAAKRSGKSRALIYAASMKNLNAAQLAGSS